MKCRKSQSTTFVIIGVVSVCSIPPPESGTNLVAHQPIRVDIHNKWNEQAPISKVLFCLTNGVTKDEDCLLVQEPHTFHFPYENDWIIHDIKFHIAGPLPSGLKINPPLTYKLTNSTESVITFFSPSTLGPNASISFSSDESFNLTEIEMIGHKTWDDNTDESITILADVEVTDHKTSDEFLAGKVDVRSLLLLIAGSVSVIVAVIAIWVLFCYCRRRYQKVSQSEH